MNRRKNPERLEDIAYREVCKMVRKVGVKWTRRLRSAAAKGRNSWLEVIKSVEEECVLLRHVIASLPVPFVSGFIVVYAVQEFTKIIASYNSYILGVLTARIYDRQTNEDICSDMLKSVLLPCVSTCSISNTQSDFVQALLIKLLYVVPNIKTLILPPVQRLSYMHLLVERIQILTHLQVFHFHIGCTTEIIVELSKYCRHMKHLSVQDSSCVDDICVEHLLKLKQLCSLNVADTSISNNGYRKLLLCLPEVQNVTWFSPIDTVLGSLTVYFPSVTKFVGTVSAAGVLVRKCPNIRELELLSPIENISELAELRNVSSLSIFQCSYTMIAVGVVIRRLGPTLTNLEMHEIMNINVDDLINYCTGLNELSIRSCHITFGRTFDRISPHFRNLEELTLRHNWGPFDFCSILHLYVNLNVLHVVGMGQITDTIIRQIVMAGGFRNMTEFVLVRCGDLSMDTAWLLMQNCPNLTKLGNISSWSDVADYEIVMLLNFLRNNNLSLVVYP